VVHELSKRLIAVLWIWQYFPFSGTLRLGMTLFLLQVIQKLFGYAEICLGLTLVCTLLLIKEKRFPEMNVY